MLALLFRKVTHFAAVRLIHVHDPMVALEVGASSGIRQEAAKQFAAALCLNVSTHVCILDAGRHTRGAWDNGERLILAKALQGAFDNFWVVFAVDLCAICGNV